MTLRFCACFAAAFAAFLLSWFLCEGGHADGPKLAPVPLATGLIVDRAKLLPADQRSQIEKRLKRIQTYGRAQIGILITNRIGEETLAQYALRVAETWRLGRKDVDNGLLILIVPDQNAARIEVGYGLEGVIPDARAAGLIRAFLLSLKSEGAMAALGTLLDQIEAALPQTPGPDRFAKFTEQHPEWQVSLTLVVFSLLTILPLIMAMTGFGSSMFSHSRTASRRGHFPSLGVCCGALISASLFAALHGFAAWTFWDSKSAGYLAAAVAFPLPLLWSLNVCEFKRLGIIARSGLILGNLCGFVWLFAVLTLFAGMGLHVGDVKELWAAPVAALLMAMVPAVFIFNGKAADWLRSLLGIYMYFVLALWIVYSALQVIHHEPTVLAFAAAGLFAVLLAVGFVLDSRETAIEKSGRGKPSQWSALFAATAILFILPFAAVALGHALLGDDFYTHIAMAAEGDGSFASLIWWIASGLGGSVLLIGLGGKFGGGGAGQ